MEIQNLNADNISTACDITAVRCAICSLCYYKSTLCCSYLVVHILSGVEIGCVLSSIVKTVDMI